MRGRSEYLFELHDGTLQITDCNFGGKSVTNDIEQVIRDFSRRRIDVDQLVIVYRDSGGRWDGVLTRGGRFVDFVLLDADSPEQAIDRMAPALDRFSRSSE